MQPCNMPGSFLKCIQEVLVGQAADLFVSALAHTHNMTGVNPCTYIINK